MSTAETMTERQAFLILNALPNIGPITLNRLLAELGGDPPRSSRRDGANSSRSKAWGR